MNRFLTKPFRYSFDSRYLYNTDPLPRHILHYFTRFQYVEEVYGYNNFAFAVPFYSIDSLHDSTILVGDKIHYRLAYMGISICRHLYHEPVVNQVGPKPFYITLQERCIPEKKWGLVVPLMIFSGPCKLSDKQIKDIVKRRFYDGDLIESNKLAEIMQEEVSVPNDYYTFDFDFNYTFEPERMHGTVSLEEVIKFFNIPEDKFDPKLKYILNSIFPYKEMKPSEYVNLAEGFFKKKEEVMN